MRDSRVSLIFRVLISMLATLPVQSQDIENVKYTGRFDFSGEFPAFSHVSSSLSANFEGSAIYASFSSIYGTSYLYVIVDGNDDPGNRKILAIGNSSPEEFLLAANLAEGPHHVEVVKLNQYDTKVAFHGFRAGGGSLLDKPGNPALSIEFYGDSNPAGHSAWDEKDWGRTSDNGGYFTYPGITARLLGAQYHNISMGGAGVTSGTWNLREYYHLIHMNEEASGSNLWAFNKFTPDVVVVNLGANDYYAGMSRNAIKKGWKDFVREDLRQHYPDAHVVLLNSWGWAIREPADYVHEAVAELEAEGDEDVSSLRIPWLWGQEHAVVNEHAGFANLLAKHIVQELGLPEADSSELSSFAPCGEVSNGSFEKSTLEGVADGWRPHGTVRLVSDSAEAFDGGRCLELGDGAWVNFANDAGASENYTVTAWVRGMNEGSEGALKLEFKDQEQKTISAAEERRSLSGEWEFFSVSARTPRTVWSLWVVLENGQGNTVRYDQVELYLDGQTQSPAAKTNSFTISVFPNPTAGSGFSVLNPLKIKSSWVMYNSGSRLVASGQLWGEASQRISLKDSLNPGLYLFSLEGAGGKHQAIKILVQ